MELIPNWKKGHKFATTWVAGFWGAMGAVIAILSALLYQDFDWRIGALLIGVSVSVAIARFTHQPGVE